MSFAALLGEGLKVFAVGVFFAVAFAILGGMCVGGIALVRSYMGVGRG